MIVAVNTAIIKIGSMHTKEEFQHYPKYYFFFLWIQRHFSKEKWTGLFQYLNLTSQITRLFYAGCAIFFIFHHFLIRFDTHQIINKYAFSTMSLLIIIGLFSLLSIALDFLLKLLVAFAPYPVLKVFSLPVTLLMIVASPITYLLLSIEKKLSLRPKKEKKEVVSRRVKLRLMEFLQEPDVKQWLTPSDQKLLVSIASFKDRITKEIMVPRIDIFAISADSTIEECIKDFIEEGYSRVPIYQDNIDNVTGILLYKNLLQFLFDHRKDENNNYLKTKIKDLASPALFAPESKKISQLLQDFKTHQSHLAIIVDEYGGTEGIVTIEDILEELVGEIADEYDINEKSLFVSVPSGGWIVDAKMSIIDIEKELSISIPEAPEYETIGGYVFHKAGAIPTKGWCIHHERFDLEVISSTDRSIDKIKITPVDSLISLKKNSEG